MNTRERRPKFPDDDRLRAWGFVVDSRPEQGKPLWNLNGMVFTEEEALILIAEMEDDSKGEVL